jgi:uncharacterized protein (TIGR02266 family)
MVERTSTRLRVVYERAAGGVRAEAFARDASLGGLFIETDAPFEVGTLLSLELSTSGTSSVAVDGRVLVGRRHAEGDDKPAGMAVRFIDLPEDVVIALGRLLLPTRPPERTRLGVGEAPVPEPSVPSTRMQTPRIIPLPDAQPLPPPPPRPEPNVQPYAPAPWVANTPPRPPSRRGLIVALVLLLIVLVAAAGALGYRYRARLISRASSPSA